MTMKTEKITEEMEKKIIHYIQLGYAAWQIKKEMDTEDPYNIVTDWNIKNIRKKYLSGISKEEAEELEKIRAKRENETKYQTEIKRLKEGYSKEELLATSGLSEYHISIREKALNKRIQKYIELGIISPEEIELARKKREMSKERAKNEDLEKRKIVLPIFRLLIFIF